MSSLKAENVKKCFSLLREFIDEAPVQGNKKGTAILVLNHLKKITAGAESGEGSGDNGTQLPHPACLIIPRLDG